MTNFFPPDVSVRLSGNRTAAQSHIGDARALLFRAINIGTSPCALTRHFDDGTSIQVLLVGKQKIVRIDALPLPPVEQPPPTPTPKDDLPGAYPVPVLYSGWMRNGSFLPSPSCAAAYGLSRTWQTVSELTPQSAVPSMYSGAMKKVVQAVMGLTKYRDPEPDYLTGAATGGEQTPMNLYNYGWTKTHGIYTAGPKNHWLIEVGSQRGVLAMPLPLVERSRGASFRGSVASRGDTDALKVLDEFGGFPSGKTISVDGAELEAAIAGGKVLRLLTAEQLGAFYTDQSAFSTTFGWAFSPDGKQAVNTTIAWRSQAGYGYNVITTVPPRYPTVRYNAFLLTGQNFQLNITLSLHDRFAPFRDVPQPCGTGSASLTLQNSGWLDPVQMGYLAFRPSGVCDVAPYLRANSGIFSWWPNNPYYQTWSFFLVNPLYGTTYQSGYGPLAYGGEVNSVPWGATLNTFYDANGSLRRLKWVPRESAAASQEGFVCDEFDTRTIPSNPASASAPRVMVGVPFCREAYSVGVWGPGPAQTVYTYAAGPGLIPVTPSPHASGGTAYPYVPQYGNYTSLYAVKVSARGTQYRATSGFFDDWMAASTSPYIDVHARVNTVSRGMPDGIDSSPTLPEFLGEQINWVGAPD